MQPEALPPLLLRIAPRPLRERKGRANTGDLMQGPGGLRPMAVRTIGDQAEEQ